MTPPPVASSATVDEYAPSTSTPPNTPVHMLVSEKTEAIPQGRKLCPSFSTAATVAIHSLCFSQPGEQFERRAVNKLQRVVVCFASVFEDWKRYDLDRLLQSLALTYAQWDTTLSFIADSTDSEAGVAVWREELEKQKESIVKKMELLCGAATTLEYLQKTKPKLLDVDAITRETAAQQYWAQFAEELKREPPHLSRVVRLLNEIRYLLLFKMFFDAITFFCFLLFVTRLTLFHILCFPLLFSLFLLRN